MKATGIVRRIDDLGRIVIPKEIRQSLRLKEGDPVELWHDGDTICLKKCAVLPYVEDRLNAVIDMLNDEDVSRKICEEDRAVVRATVNMLLAKWRQEDEK